MLNSGRKWWGLILPTSLNLSQWTIHENVDYIEATVSQKSRWQAEWSGSYELPIQLLPLLLHLQRREEQGLSPCKMDREVLELDWRWITTSWPFTTINCGSFRSLSFRSCAALMNSHFLILSTRRQGTTTVADLPAEGDWKLAGSNNLSPWSGNAGTTHGQRWVHQKKSVARQWHTYTEKNNAHITIVALTNGHLY